MKKNILISTGGSGGHVVPATIFYEHLKKEYNIFISTDNRGINFLDKYKYNIEIFNTPKISKNIFSLPVQFFSIIHLMIKSFFFLKRKKIDIMISTGGYMSLPLCLASRFLKIKLFLFEPNMVLGRSNKIFTNSCIKIFSYSENIKNLPIKFKNKISLIPTLLRKEFYEYKKAIDLNKEISLLIIGGSQGAKFFDEILTSVIIKVSKQLKIEIYQQVQDRNKKILIEEKYKNHNIKYKLFDFDENLHEKLYDYDLAITRSGASAISELSQLCIPFIAIPFPFAKDNHQLYNAKIYENLNCCWIINQDKIEEETFSSRIIQLFKEKHDYYMKKENLEKISNQNTWNIVNKKLFNLINEN